MTDINNTSYENKLNWLTNDLNWWGIGEILNHYTILWERALRLFSVTPEQGLQNLEFMSRRYKKTGKPLLLMLESNPFTPDVYQYILDLAATREIPVKIFSCNVLDQFNDNVDLVYYPTWYCQQQNMLDFQEGKDKTFRFSFLASQARFHRLYLYQRCKQWITPEDCIAVHANNYEIQQHFISRDMQQHLPNQIDLLSDVPCVSNVGQDSFYSIMQSNQDQIDYQVDFTNQHNAYSAMINITGESNIDADHVFLSEKTWKPIRSGCLTMTLGNNQTVTMLNRLGFEIPDSVDPELPLMEKIHYIADKMSSWTYDDCCTIYNDNRREIDHNQSWFYSSELKHQFVNQIKHKLEIA